MVFDAKRKIRKVKDINIRLTAVVVGFKQLNYVPKESCVCGALMVCLWYMEVHGAFKLEHLKEVRLFFVLIHFVKVLVSESLIEFIVV